MPDALRQLLTATDTNGRARAIALDLQPDQEPADLFGYHSSGRVLIVSGADLEPAMQAATTLAAAGLQCLLLSTDPIDAAGTDIAVLQAAPATLSGFLGQFVLTLAGSDPQGISLPQLLGADWASIDLVLDLGEAALIDSALSPPGYHHPTNPESLADALKELPELVGEFDKPRYYQLDSDRCAHARSGINACNRCLDACPADAISPAGDAISVEPGLCQGAGICATVCPSGAINYQYPQRRDSINALRELLARYREADGQRPLLLLHDAVQGSAMLQAVATGLPGHVLPLQLEEAGSTGLELWFSALAYGATVAILLPATTPASVRDALIEQIGHGRRILSGMGYDPGLLTLLQADSTDQLPALLAELPATQLHPAGFAALNDKREALFLALDHLQLQAPSDAPMTALEPGAPFGEVIVEQQRCTLCMACVSQCPAGALLAGGETPALRFIEQHCIQCGLCANSCPEDAITPSPRLLFEPLARRRERLLKEEQPFDCVVCGKPFATGSMVNTIKAKLSGHPMFAGSALRRLEMCEDCRVIDIHRSEHAELQS